MTILLPKKYFNIFVNKCWPYHFLPLLGGGLYGSVLVVDIPLGIVGMIFWLGRLSCCSHKEITLKSELLALALFSLGWCCLALPWIAHTLHELYGVPKPWNILLFGLCSLFMFPQYFLFILFYRLGKRWTLNLSQKMVLTALGLTLFEWYGPQFFPFYLGHAWLHVAPYVGLAPVGGVPLYSFFSFLLLLMGLSWYRMKRINRPIMAMIAVFVAINLAMPLEPPEGERKIRMRLVQPNMSNALRISAERNIHVHNKIFQELYNMSLRSSEKLLDLIIWPELVLPAHVGLSPPYVVRDVIAETGVPLVFGGYNRDGTSLYNALFFYDSQSRLQGIYRKQKRVPLVEFLPFGSLNKYVRPYINFTFFEKGVEYPLFKTENDIHFLGIICYEAIFSDYVRDYLQKQTVSPHFIINLSNDSWYGDSLEPFQHKFLAHWRALEFNIPVVRASNTGISSVLYPDGSESSQMKFGEKGNLDVDVAIKERTPTIFEKYGPWVTWVLGSILFLGVSLTGGRKRHGS